MRQGRVHVALARIVGEDDQVGLRNAFATDFIGFALQHRVDADAGASQQAGQPRSINQEIQARKGVRKPVLRMVNQWGSWVKRSDLPLRDLDSVVLPKAQKDDGEGAPAEEIAAQLAARGKGYRWMVIGENLAMENERIHFLPVNEVNADYDMNAVVILDER